jgi:hypothetical protein
MTVSPATSATIAELRAACDAGDQHLERLRRIRTDIIRGRVDQAAPGPWISVDRRGNSDRGQVEIRRTDGWSYTRIANVLRGGRNPAADGDLIANAPTDLAWLLTELARVRAERDLLLAAADDGTRLNYYSHRADARQQELRARR